MAEGAARRRRRRHAAGHQDGPPLQAKQPRSSVEGGEEREGATSVLRLPPEVQLLHIASFLPLPDLLRLGQTCRYLHGVCDSEAAWRRLAPPLSPAAAAASAQPYKRAAILRYTQGLQLQSLGRRVRVVSLLTSLSHGYRKLLPAGEHIFLLDHGGTLSFLCHVTPRPPPGHHTCYFFTLCRGVKDVTAEPHGDPPYIYALAGQDEGDCVEVFQPPTARRVFHMSFHPSLRFRQLALAGPAAARALLLLTEAGKVYSLPVDEALLGQPRSYTTRLALCRLCGCPAIRALTASRSSVAFLTDSGNVFLKGTRRHGLPVALALPTKVLCCALGRNHLGLLDEFGRLFMQGCNRYGQLGTGDRLERRAPTQVPAPRCPRSLWCGLNHSLVLAGGAELLGCGSGAGGRLPGWPRGSAAFVRLHVRVPRWASGLCASRRCLYLLCGYDVERPPGYRELPEPPQ